MTIKYGKLLNHTNPESCYNASLGPHNAMVVPYVEGKFDITNYFGAVKFKERIFFSGM
jgi:hypothetical protein